MISPIATVIKNKTKELRRYRFARFHIALEPINDADGGDVFRFNGDIFTLIDNDEEAQQLLYDHQLGYIELTYELDDSVKAANVGKVAQLSDKANALLLRRADTGNDGTEFKRIVVLCTADGGKTRLVGAHVRVNDSQVATTGEYGTAEVWVPADKNGYDLYASADGYTDYHTPRTAGQNVIQFQTMQRKARGKQQFLVLGAGGVAIEGAAVVIERVGTKITNAEGIAEFDNVPLENTKKAGSKVNPKFPSSQTQELNSGKFKYHVYYPGYLIHTGELPKGGTAERAWVIKLIYDWQEPLTEEPAAVEPSENQ